MRIESEPTHQQQLLQIQRHQVESLKETQATEAHEKAETQTVQREEDQVILSAEAQELRRLRQAVEELPDIQAKVEAIREAVAEGTYQIPEEELIERLLGIH